MNCPLCGTGDYYEGSCVHRGCKLFRPGNHVNTVNTVQEEGARVFVPQTDQVWRRTQLLSWFGKPFWQRFDGLTAYYNGNEWLCSTNVNRRDDGYNLAYLGQESAFGRGDTRDRAAEAFEKQWPEWKEMVPCIPPIP